MEYFSLDQWLVIALAFLLGLLLGMAMMAGGKWKRRYREEARRREEIEAENKRLRQEYAESDSLHRAALRDIDRREDRSALS